MELLDSALLLEVQGGQHLAFQVGSLRSIILRHQRAYYTPKVCASPETGQAICKHQYRLGEGRKNREGVLEGENRQSHKFDISFRFLIINLPLKMLTACISELGNQ